MLQEIAVGIITVWAFSLHLMCGGERYQFFLDIHDIFDSSWVESEHDMVGTTVKCASLCYRYKEKCAYFGYKNKTCYLLKDTVDRNACSQDNCTDDGMKIYKWYVEDSTTPTSKVSTSTPSFTSTPTEIPETSPESTTNIPNTTTVPTETSAITEFSKTSSTPTISTEADTTPTPTKTDTTTPTIPDITTPTIADSTTPTIPDTTTPTTAGTTSTPGTTSSTTPGSWECPLPAAFLKCDKKDLLLRQMASKASFFSDITGADCSTLGEQVYEDEEEVLSFMSRDGFFNIDSHCSHPHQVVVSFELCIVDARVKAITLHCNKLKDPDIMEEHYNSSSKDEDGIHQRVNCGEKGAIQDIYFMDAKDERAPITRVDFSCVRLNVKGVVPDPAGSTKL